MYHFNSPLPLPLDPNAWDSGARDGVQAAYIIATASLDFWRIGFHLACLRLLPIAFS